MSQKTEALFISDVHLGSRGCNAAPLYEVLKQYNPTYLFIVGDFIDGWLLSKRFYWKPEFTRVIQRILKMASQGTQVIYVTGNHDEFLREYTPLQLDNIHIVDEYIFKNYLITHGDKYDGIIQMKWLGVLGSYGYEIAIFIDRTLKRLGYKKSLSKLLKDKVKEAVKFVTNFERQLGYQAFERGCDGVICGHIHKPVYNKLTIKDSPITYINCGDWIENNSYVHYGDGGFSLRRYRDND
jgi:UDP-2,3-diacylglucosamine pyrophosphatase LpxH